MPVKSDEGFCVYGSGVFPRLLDALASEEAGVRQAEDIEYIHRMRVASRRLRAALPLFETCLPAKSYKHWLRQVRSITRALGAARDTDVQINVLEEFRSGHPEPPLQPGLRRLHLRLGQKRAQLQSEVLSALDKFAASGTLPEIQGRIAPYLERQGQVYLYTPFLYMRAYEAVTQRMEEFLGYEPFIEKPECVTELHAMRIAAKRLRYTLEVFAPIYPGEMKTALQTVRKVQESLGDIHDCDVWTAFLPAFLNEEREFMIQFYGHSRSFRRLTPGLQAFLEDRQARRDAEYGRFVTYWRKIRSQGVWDEVLKTIRIPFFQGEMPPAAQAETPAGEGRESA